MCNKQ